MSHHFTEMPIALNKSPTTDVASLATVLEPSQCQSSVPARTATVYSKGTVCLLTGIGSGIEDTFSTLAAPGCCNPCKVRCRQLRHGLGGLSPIAGPLSFWYILFARSKRWQLRRTPSFDALPESF